MKQIGKAPLVFDVVNVVEKLNKLKKGTSDYDNTHKLAVAEVEKYNSYHGHGFGSMSLSKARSIIQEMCRQEKNKVKISTNYRKFPRSKKKKQR